MTEETEADRRQQGGKTMYQCDMNKVPVLGLIGMVSHRAMNTAKGMYQEFDLNRSQASVLFMLHQRDSMSQKELAAQVYRQRTGPA